MPPKVTRKFWLAYPLWIFSDARLWELRERFGDTGELIVHKFFGLAGSCDSGGYLVMNNRPMSVELFSSYQRFDSDICRNVFSEMVDMGLAVYENDMWGVSPEFWDELCRYENDREKNRQKTANRRARLAATEVKETSDVMPVEVQPGGNVTYLPSAKSGNPKRQAKQATPEAIRLAELLAEQILDYVPDYLYLRDGRKGKTLESYAHEIDLMLTRDKRDPEEVEKVILYATNDRIRRGDNGFCWADNIQSAAKLREKFEKLRIQATAHDSVSRGKAVCHEIESADVLSIMTSI